MRHTLSLLLISAFLCCFLTACHQKQVEKASSYKPAVQTVPVSVITLEPQKFGKNVPIPGDLFPYEVVDVYPKVLGFIQKVYVDRGSIVHRGQLLAYLIAPEMEAQITEARSNVQAAASQEAEARAKYLSDYGVYERYNEAAQTPGVISQNELETSKMTAQASLAQVKAVSNTIRAKQANVVALQKIQAYLQITAPIDGVVTDRNLHPGALVGPSKNGDSEPIFRIQTLSHLRLVVPVPERYYSGVKLGARIPFTVSAYPERTFYGVISRPSYALNPKTRTESVELDVFYPDATLSPGMYTEVLWPISRPKATFQVPASAVVSTTEETFVNRITPDNRVEWVPVRPGFSDGNRVEVFGNLHTGDRIVKNGTDELRPNMPVRITSTPQSE